MSISTDVLRLDPEQEVARIANSIRAQVRSLRRKGVVVALSGGIDSSVVCALCVRALEKERVHALLLPEKESAFETTELGRIVVERLGIPSEEIDITTILQAVGCYEKRDAAVRSIFPDYGDGWKFKIVLPPLWERKHYRFFSLVVQAPGQPSQTAPLSPEAYEMILAATNFKQRVRKMLEYFHADRLRYAVAGTPNRLEYDQGFFVKLGDGAADLKPIAHLYKTQVYQLGEFLELPTEVLSRPPTTDTYSMSQSQEEFYFAVDFKTLDLCLYAKNHGVLPVEVAKSLGLSVDQVARVYQDIDQKRRATRYNHLPPFLVGQRLEICTMDVVLASYIACDAGPA